MIDPVGKREEACREGRAEAREAGAVPGAQRARAVARPGRGDDAVAAPVDRPVGQERREGVAPARLVETAVRVDAAEVVVDDREALGARAGEQLAELRALRERERRTRPAVEVDAVDQSLVGQVVVREQAQVAGAARGREQDR